MSDTCKGTSTPTWVEFTHGMCEQLNSLRCLVLVGDAASIQPVRHLVEEACQHSTVAAAFAMAPRDANASLSTAPADMPHVTFTTEENQRMVQRCMAVYGRVPFLAVVDMRDDDDGHAFVFDLDGTSVASTTASASLVESMVDFFVRVGCGAEPRCRQGVAPPPGDVFEPTHGAVLCEARTAVTSTFSRLMGKTTTAMMGGCNCPCGALCVFWSDRCPCCPGVLMLIEALVALIRLVAARHADHPASNISFTFPFLVANIDDNDFTPEEWPVARREQVVPSVVAYPAPSFEPVVFAGERSVGRLVSFICQHCLPSADCVACTPHIQVEAEKAAAQLSIDELMTVMKEESAAYAAAVQAYTAYESAAPTVEATARLHAAFRAIRTSALPFSLDTGVRRMSAEGGAAAAGSLTVSPVADEDGGDGSDVRDDVAESKAGGLAGAAGAVAAVVDTAMPPVAAVVGTYKRTRE